ncbi:MAG: HD domain-containing protein [Epsilonproteobacteria bacterium]|nr:HD domain-containing protein [Campylobacterota bacterium]
MAVFKIAKSKNREQTSLDKKWKIAVVDDDEEVHIITKSVLSKFEFEKRGVEILSAYSAKEALELLKREDDVAVIFLDVVMESDDAGLKLVPLIRKELQNSEIRIVLRTGQPGSAPEKEVIRDYDINDYKEKTELTATKLYTTLISSLRAYENIRSIKELSREIIDTQSDIIKRLGNMVENRSKETGTHVERVAKLSYNLAKFAGLSEDEALRLQMASPMHDVGKIGIPDSILLKPGKFEDDEFEFMKSHAKIGYEILGGSNREILKAAAIVAHEHHEKWDGSGYPRGLKGEEIHIYGRITAIADVFDALSQERVYKKAWKRDEIFDFLRSQRAKHFDPNLIDLFFENIDVILKDLESA